MASNAFVATDHERCLLGPAPNPVSSSHIGPKWQRRVAPYFQIFIAPFPSVFRALNTLADNQYSLLSSGAPAYPCGLSGILHRAAVSLQGAFALPLFVFPFSGVSPRQAGVSYRPAPPGKALYPPHAPQEIFCCISPPYTSQKQDGFLRIVP